MSKEKKSKKLSWALRSTVRRCDRLVNRNKGAYHIVYIYGDYFVVPTKFYQENLSHCRKSISNNLNFQHLKAQYYYDGEPVKPPTYKPQQTPLTQLIDETNQLIYLRENLDIGIGMPLDYRRKIKVNLEKEKQLRLQIRANIKKIKRDINAGTN